MLNKFVCILLLLSQGVLAEDAVKFLKAGTPAPFDGYLITQEKAEKIRNNDLELVGTKKLNQIISQENVLLNTQLNNANTHVTNLSGQLVKAKDNSFLGNVGYFLLGALATTAISYGVVKTLK